MLMRWSVLFVPVCLAIVGGCSAYVDNFYYRPRPGIVEIPPPTTREAPPVTGFASVIGVRNEDRSANLPPSIEVRVRIENNSGGPVGFDPRTLELIDGSLVKFPPPIVRPDERITLQPKESLALSAFFPFPPGHTWHNTDLESLQLRWLVDVNGRTDGLAVNFHRVAYVYHDPYWYGGPPVFYGGFVYVHHHR